MPHPAQGQELLVNGDFESGAVGWSSFDASLSPSTPARSGDLALAIDSSSYAQSVSTFQERAANPGWGYDFSAWMLLADPDIQRAFLRITWLDALNMPILTEDSTWIGAPAGTFQRAASGTRIAPPGSSAVRLGLVILTSGPFTALADDASFSVVLAPTPTAPAPTVPPTSAPTSPPTQPRGQLRTRRPPPYQRSPRSPRGREVNRKCSTL